ncbi:Crp/Fnr family transcriptional regulator, partial [Pseudomonas aeruginosa]|nr:Crp/Fnr family transcriptional regulator [Pseudomonas aeruginosa]
MLLAVEERSRLEVGIVGSEGFVGLSVFHAARQSNNQAIVQGGGAALAMEAADFSRECARGGTLPRLLERYTYALFTQISQLAVCNRFHAT